jgi:hypothetical protein
LTALAILLSITPLGRARSMIISNAPYMITPNVLRLSGNIWVKIQRIGAAIIEPHMVYIPPTVKMVIP